MTRTSNFKNEFYNKKIFIYYFPITGLVGNNMIKRIQLPPPQNNLDFPLMKALELRRTKRKWRPSDFTHQELSNLLWAACGITQEETKKSKSRRTAPSACNTQEIKVYIALSHGFFIYEENNHQLIEVSSSDIRMNLGTQKMMKSAPLGLIYVSDFFQI